MRTRIIVTLAIAAAIVFGVFGGSAGAVTNGTFDGNGHPYVAYLDNGVFACSGTLLSPTVLLTAAHCFSDSTSAFGTNSSTGAPIVRDVVLAPGVRGGGSGERTVGGGAGGRAVPVRRGAGVAADRARHCG